ncbi:MAG: 50S ribosomal protein L23 [Candidatus Pacearchaeota archaeon]|jgi:ribosomal protein L23
MSLKPVVTEKAVMGIERDNLLTFEAPMILTKTEIKKELEKLLNIKIEKMRTLIRNNKKYVYAKLNKNTLAIDIATKLGMM